MRKFSKFIILFLSLSFAFLLVACGEDITISFSADTVSIQVNQEKLLEPTVSVEEFELEWSTSDPTVVTVTDGTIKGLKVGEATVTVKVKGEEDVSASITVKVEAIPVVNPTQVLVSGASATAKVYDTMQLTSSVVPNTASQEVTWSTSKGEVATVSDTGLVTFVGIGSVIITCASASKPDIKREVQISVFAPDPTSITVSADKTTVVLNETLQMTATVAPALSEQGVTWSTSDSSLAVVDANSGLVTARGVGTVEIIATSTAKQDISGKLEIEITIPLPDSVSLTGPESIIQVGEELQLVTQVLPVLANQEVTYSSSDETKATVDENGKVVGVGEGEVTITVTSIANDEVTASYEIKVVAQIVIPEFTNIIVDASLAENDRFSTITVDDVEYIIGINAFDELADALPVITEGKQVILYAGEHVVDAINLAHDNISFVGPNASIDPNTGERGDEAILIAKINIATGLKNISFTGLTFNYNPAACYIAVAEAGKVDGVTVSYNIVNGAAGGGAEAFFRGHYGKNADATNKNFVFEHNYINNISADRAIRLAYMENLTINYNVFKDCTSDAIRIRDNGGGIAGTLYIKDNKFLNVGQYGIFIEPHVVSVMEITGNEFDRNGYTIGAGGAISIRGGSPAEGGTDILVKDNIFKDSKDIHIRFDHALTETDDYVIMVENNEFYGPTPTIYTNNLAGVVKTTLKNNSYYDLDNTTLLDPDTLGTKVKNATIVTDPE